MYSTIMVVLNDVLVNFLPDLQGTEDERIIQDVLRSRLSLTETKFESGVVLSAKGLWNAEVDLLGQGVAIELKVNPKFYDGIGQVVAISELLGLELILLQIWREMGEEMMEAARKLSVGQVPRVHNIS